MPEIAPVTTSLKPPDPDRVGRPVGIREPGESPVGASADRLYTLLRNALPIGIQYAYTLH
jgi:hypothetical protein